MKHNAYKGTKGTSRLFSEEPDEGTPRHGIVVMASIIASEERREAGRRASAHHRRKAAENRQRRRLELGDATQQRIAQVVARARREGTLGPTVT